MTLRGNGRGGAHRADGPPADLGRLEFPTDQAMAFFHGLVEAGAAVQAEGAGTIDIPALMQQVAAEQGYSPWLQPSRVADDAPMRPVTTLRPRNSRES